ncbi:MAG: tRNA 5-methoxyuridine(34)/uridine 5-oxyacetic acid(34) synthase CmoB [Pseudomonadota bacterium]
MNLLDDYQSLYTELREAKANDLLVRLEGLINKALQAERNANLETWQAVLDRLPAVSHPSVAWTDNCLAFDLKVGEVEQRTHDLGAALHELHPWRKGPLRINSVSIDTEWRSDWKWHRLEDAITPLTDRRVLDVGCGNGYHCWRMYLDGAKQVIGIDPTLLYIAQFQACKHFAGNTPVWVLPLALETLGDVNWQFDSVFSMGVLYHRRSPLDHLFDLQRLLRPGGELVLETLVVDGPEGHCLLPPGRYAQMRNVWFLPSVPTLVRWMRRCGFESLEVVDVTPTRVAEQHSTEWMQFQSLPDFLDPNDANKTIEGHPAPQRAIVLGIRR